MKLNDKRYHIKTLSLLQDELTSRPQEILQASWR